MASIAKLVVSLGANIAGFETDMKRATSNQKKRMRQMEREAAAAGRAIGAAFVATAAGVGALVRNTTKAADEIQKLSLKTGLSTEALSQYRHVADLSGVSFEGMGNAVRRMQRSISDANVGLSTQTRAFERLGLSVDDLLKLSPQEQFEKIGGALNNMSDATLRSATAQELLGRSGTEMLSVFANGEEGMRAMREEADRLGLTIGQDMANASALFNDNMTRLGATFKGASNTLVGEMLPALIDMQEYFLKSGDASNFAAEAGQFLADVLKTLVTAFIIVKEGALAFGKVLVGLGDLIYNTFKGLLAPVTQSIKSVVEAFAALRSGNFAAAGEAIAKTGARIGEEFDEAARSVRNAQGFLKETFVDLGKNVGDAVRQIDAAGSSARKLPPVLKKAAAESKALATQTENFAEAADDVTATLKSYIDELEEMDKEQQAVAQSGQALLDTLFPMEAATRQFVDQLELLRQYASDAGISAERLAEAEIRLANSFADATRGIAGQTDQLSLLQVAINESVRILERTFSSLFDGLVNDSQDAWGTIESGFKSMISSIAQTPVRGVFTQIQQAFSPGGGGLSSLSLSGDFGQDLVRSIGNIIGLSNANGLVGQAGSLFGSIAGEALGAKFLGGLGSFAGPVGSALGAIAGSFLGNILGDLFGIGKEREPILQASGFNTFGQSKSDQDTLVESLLGDIFIRTRRLDSGAINDISSALEEFDKVIAGLANQDQIESITQALKAWGVQMEGAAISVEQLLSSRLHVVLGSFSDEIQAFVNRTSDLEEQLARLGVGVAAGELLSSQPEVFSGRTVTQILSVVEAMQDGAETITDAFEQFLLAADAVVSIKKALEEFAGSNLGDDFANTLGQSLEDALSTVNQALLDSITNFDGSIQSLETIGQLSLVVREGELKLLAQIDAIQKGLNANLDKLRNDILGITAEPQSISQTLLGAEKLIFDLGNAQTAGDVAALGQQFEALVRGLDEDQTNRAGADLVTLIDLFQQRSNAQLEAFKQDTLDNAASIRDVVDTFVAEIGDPLDIIAASLDEQNLSDTMDEGLERIDQSVQQIGPQVANALGAVFGDGITVNVQIGEPGLVTG